MKDELQFILENYRANIEHWLDIKFAWEGHNKISASFFADSEEYADELTRVQTPTLHYKVEKSPMAEYDVPVLFYQDYSIGEKTLTDLSYCRIGKYKFLKIITPFTRDRSYDIIIAKYDEMESILKELTAKQEASNFKVDDYPVVGIDFGMLKANTVDFLLNGEFREFCKKHRIPLKRGVVLEGKPGTGKTMSLRWLKNQALKNDIHFHSFTSVKEFLDDRDEYFENNKKIFVFEDFDTALLDREKTGNTPNDVLGQVLNTLEGINQIQDTVSVFTTNKIGVFDSAFIRPGRIDKVITYSLPNRDNIIDFIDIYLADLDLESKNLLVGKLVDKNIDISYAVLKGICDDINIFVFNKGFEELNGDVIANIAKEKVEGANRQTKVSDSSDMIL